MIEQSAHWLKKVVGFNPTMNELEDYLLGIQSVAGRLNPQNVLI